MLILYPQPRSLKNTKTREDKEKKLKIKKNFLLKGKSAWSVKYA